MLRRTYELLQAALLIWQLADNCNALTGPNYVISKPVAKGGQQKDLTTGWIGGCVCRITCAIGVDYRHYTS